MRSEGRSVAAASSPACLFRSSRRRSPGAPRTFFFINFFSRILSEEWRWTHRRSEKPATIELLFFRCRRAEIEDASEVQRNFPSRSSQPRSQHPLFFFSSLNLKEGGKEIRYPPEQLREYYIPSRASLPITLSKRPGAFAPLQNYLKSHIAAIYSAKDKAKNVSRPKKKKER